VTKQKFQLHQRRAASLW